MFLKIYDVGANADIVGAQGSQKSGIYNLKNNSDFFKGFLAGIILCIVIYISLKLSVHIFKKMFKDDKKEEQ